VHNRALELIDVTKKNRDYRYSDQVDMPELIRGNRLIAIAVRAIHIAPSGKSFTPVRGWSAL
jgi:hypothetical protein